VSCGVHMIANALETTGIWNSDSRFAQSPEYIHKLRHHLGHFLLEFSLWTVRGCPLEGIS
jgi:hypothetical protein